MTALTLPPPDLRNAELPQDLREALGERTLLRFALDGAQSLERSSLEAIARREKEFRPQMMLTLLSYCYAAGINGSKDIEHALWTDTTVRYICARTYPDWLPIRRFRRQNRALVEQCLAYVLKKAWMLDLDQSGEEWRGCVWNGCELDLASAAAARNKIEVAIITDTAESD